MKKKKKKVKKSQCNSDAAGCWKLACIHYALLKIHSLLRLQRKVRND